VHLPKALLRLLLTKDFTCRYFANSSVSFQDTHPRPHTTCYSDFVSRDTRPAGVSALDQSLSSCVPGMPRRSWRLYNTRSKTSPDTHTHNVEESGGAGVQRLQFITRTRTWAKAYVRQKLRKHTHTHTHTHTTSSSPPSSIIIICHHHHHHLHNHRLAPYLSSSSSSPSFMHSIREASS
jgi:hypothetical protein